MFARSLHAAAAAGGFLLLLLPGAAPAAAGELSAGPAQSCRGLIREAEREHRIPAELLAAISLTESGRFDAARGEHIAWPWTVYAEGRGRYFATRAEAAAEIRRLKARGVSNIDVGCMQVNLYYHGDAFDSPEEALDPAENVAYAAGFLLDLKQKTNSWTQAIGLYHSSSEERQRAYRDKVTRFWHIERRRAAAERQQRTQAAWTARQAERRAALAERREALAARRAAMTERARVVAQGGG